MNWVVIWSLCLLSRVSAQKYQVSNYYFDTSDKNCEGIPTQLRFLPTVSEQYTRLYNSTQCWPKVCNKRNVLSLYPKDNTQSSCVNEMEEALKTSYTGRRVMVISTYTDTNCTQLNMAVTFYLPSSTRDSNACYTMHGMKFIKVSYSFGEGATINMFPRKGCLGQMISWQAANSTLVGACQPISSTLQYLQLNHISSSDTFADPRQAVAYKVDILNQSHHVIPTNWIILLALYLLFNV